MTTTTEYPPPHPSEIEAIERPRLRPCRRRSRARIQTTSCSRWRRRRDLIAPLVRPESHRSQGADRAERRLDRRRNRHRAHEERRLGLRRRRRAAGQRGRGGRRVAHRRPATISASTPAYILALATT